jgi:TusA-related sulfurtransferase
LAGQADIILDFRGTIASISLLKMTLVFCKMEPRQILEIRGSDPDTRQDLFKVLPEASFEVLAMDTVDQEEGYYQVRIRKCG